MSTGIRNSIRTRSTASTSGTPSTQSTKEHTVEIREGDGSHRALESGQQSRKLSKPTGAMSQQRSAKELDQKQVDNANQLEEMRTQNAALVSELEVRFESLELDLAAKVDARQSRCDELRGISLEIKESPPSETLAKTPPQAPLEMFDVSPRPEGQPARFIEPTVNSNHGHPAYTCIYRLRAHGNKAEDDQN
ncbi:unnamed protein product [Mesocestoides corti]|uniref:SUN domain-containing protein n=1 Tax=Mesocestoides corti TaxID=53468 RepID=A0A0R3U8L8_MESCO|nr:unnamed protein product [Mesocestoides corti]